MTDRASPDPRAELRTLIRDVRRRWRLRVLLRGLAVTLLVSLGVFLLSALLLERFRFTPGSVVAARAAAALLIVAAGVWFVGRPLLRRPTDLEIALYLEEHEPALEAALVSAVEALDPGAAAGSPALGRAVVELAVRRARELEVGHDLERPQLRRAGAIVLGVTAAAAALLLAGPAFVRHAAVAIFAPWSSARAATPYAIEVAPGNATVARGGDQRIAARLHGFGAERVELAVRREGASEWERVAMGEEGGGHAYRLFDLAEPVEYYVEAAGVRSPVYRLAVMELPAVARLELVYRYPAYTGLGTETVADVGDIAAPRGTVVLVRIAPTVPVPAGRLAMEHRPPIPLAPDSAGMLAGAIRVDRDGFYAVQLQAPDGEMVEASLDYAIEVLPDRAPSVRIVEPGRDARVTSVEEVFTRVEAEDDYGVARVELVYAVNGGAERVVLLHRGRPRLEVSAGWTFFLEEHSLAPGDLVAYYARAADADAVAGAKTAATDIYFMRVRPFGQEYREAEQAGTTGGEMGESPAGLSARQREIIAATFRTLRDSAAVARREYAENLATLTLAQGRIRQQVEALNGRLARVAAAGLDSVTAAIAAELPRAIEAMQEAEDRLARRRPREALPPEQRALQHLQRAEAAYREVQVALGGQPGMGGGGEQDPDDLADLLELETDRLQNQYETVERSGAESASREVDEVMERLRELARRQQQESERLRREAERLRAPGAQRGSTGGGAQRRLAAEAEELARRLERLSRERESPALSESARRLQQAADEMRRAAARGGQGERQASRALRELEETRRRLERDRGDRLERAAAGALEQARRLAARQERLAGETGAAVRERSGERLARLDTARDSLAQGVDALERDLDRLSRDARGEDAEAARRLREAANAAREGRLADRIRFGRDLARRATPEAAEEFDRQTAEGIGAMAERIAAAGEALGDDGERGGERALGRARELVRGMESLDRRLRERAEAGAARMPAQAPPGGSGQGAPAGGAVGAATDDRQLARELRELRENAEALRRDVAGRRLDPAELDRLIGDLRALEGRTRDDSEETARLRAAVVEGLKAFEFALARALEPDRGTPPRLGPDDEVPPEYRELVARYYESLARD